MRWEGQHSACPHAITQPIGVTPHTSPHLESLDVPNELVLLLCHTFVVHSMEVSLLPELVPCRRCLRSYQFSVVQLPPKRRDFLLEILSENNPANGHGKNTVVL